MSWEDKIENVKFSIIMGDGKVFYPKLILSNRSREFNSMAFDFINVSDTLVERKKPKGFKYPLTFVFDGSDNVDESIAFDTSAKDSRIWVVTHPFWGPIKGHPISIEYDNTNLNITFVSVDFWETIDVNYPNSNYSVKDNTFDKKNQILDDCATSYATTGEKTSADIVKNKDSNILVASSFNELQTDETYADYQNAFSEAQKANDNLIIDPYTAITKTQSLLDKPSGYDTPVTERAKAYLKSYQRLKKSLITISDKLFFESQGATCIASYCNAVVNPIEGDYKLITELDKVSSDLTIMYDDYQKTLDNSSTSIYDTNNYWQPDPSVQTNLNDLVNYTNSNLYNLGVDSQQERIVYLDKDTNVILLAHRYIGLDVNDENLELFIKINDIKLKELFRLKKGRKIKYYV